MTENLAWIGLIDAWFIQNMFCWFVVRQMDNLDSSQSVLRDSHGLESYNGTKYTDEVDTRFPPNEEDIDARFGASTRMNERYNTRSLDHTFSDSYQLDGSYKTRVGEAPKGIFDDV